MGQTLTKNIWRFLLLFLLQVLIFRQLNLGGLAFNYIQVFIYPLFLLLLPVAINRILLLFLGFTLGLLVDMFYNTPGLHASASVLTAFIRPFILNNFAPRGGYKLNAIPLVAEFGTRWFFRYAAVALVIHLTTYFFVEAFTLIRILDVLLKTICSFLASMLLIFIYMLIFNPKT